MDIRRFAAIDIGSNSVRLLVEQAFAAPEGTRFSKILLLRLPVRLGEDAFTDLSIRPSTTARLCDAMTAFKAVMRLHDVKHYKAVATSAMRDATNGADVAEEVYRRTGVRVRILSGDEEASLINVGQRAFALKIKRDCLFVDVGGGSTEVVVFADGHPVAAASFRIGTIRLLKDKVKKSEWKELRRWLEEHTAGIPDLSLVGSGGNINRIFKLVGGSAGMPMQRRDLSSIVDKLREVSIDERMTRYGLHPDRADVIVPAGDVFLTIMSWMDIDHIYVPKLGLSDGLIHVAYQEYISAPTATSL